MRPYSNPFFDRWCQAHAAAAEAEMTLYRAELAHLHGEPARPSLADRQHVANLREEASMRLRAYVADAGEQAAANRWR
jgi:hypothetical protein